MRSARPRWKRLLGGACILTGATVAALILLTAAVLLIGPVSRAALRTGLSTYNEVIPGHIAVSEIGGSLRALRLRNIVITDGQGRRIAEAKEIDLVWSPLHLLFGELRVLLFRLTDGRLSLSDAEGPTRFGDLAPPGSGSDDGREEQAPRSQGLGPRVPLDVQGTVIVDGFDLAVYSESRGASHIVRDAVVSASVSGHDRRFRANIRGLAGRFPVPDIRIFGAALNLSWDGRSLTGTELVAAANLGFVSSELATVDFQSQAGSGSIRVKGERAFLQRLTGVPFAVDPLADLQVSGTLADAVATALITLDDRTSAAIQAEGALVPFPDVRTRFSVRSSAPGTYLKLPAGSAEGSGELRFIAHRGGELTLIGTATCGRCRLPPLGEVQLNGTVDVRRDRGTASVSMETASSRAEVAATIRGGRLGHAKWSVEAQQIALVDRLLSTRVALPDLSGRVESAGACERRRGGLSCEGELAVASLRVSVLRVEKGTATFSLDPFAEKRPFSAALTLRGMSVAGETVPRQEVAVSGNTDGLTVDVTAERRGRTRLNARFSVSLGAATEVRIARLDGRFRGVRGALVGTAAATVGSERVRVEPLALRIAGGRIFVRGDIPIARGARGDVALDAEGLDLGRVTAAVPGVRLDGTVDLGVRLRGMAREPRLALTAEVRALRGPGFRAEAVSLRAASSDRQLTAEAAVIWDGVEALRLSLAAPVRIRPLEMTAAVLPRRPGELSVRMRRLDLRLFRALSPEFALTGVVDLDAALTGPLAAPEGSVRAALTDLAYGALPLGSGTLDVRYQGGRITAQINTENGPYRSAEITADAGVAVDLATPRLALSEAPRYLTFNIDGLDLSQVKAYVPEAEMTGTVDLHGGVTGTSVAVEIRTSPITVIGHRLGAVSMTAEMEDRRTAWTLDIDGGVARRIHIAAVMPLFLDGAARPVWLDSAPQHACVRLRSLDLNALRALMDALSLAPEGVPFPEGGDLALRLDISGTSERPVINGDVTLRNASLNGEPLDRTNLRAQYADRVLRLGGGVTREDDDKATLAATVPLSLTLRPLAARWLGEGSHDVRIDLHHVDAASLAPFAGVPAGTDFTVNASLAVTGTASLFDLNGRYKGEIRRTPLSPVTFEGTFRAGPGDQELALEVEQSATPMLSLLLTAKAPVMAIVNGTIDPLATRVNGDLEIPGISLTTTEGLLPPAFFDITGEVYGRVRADGTLLTPRVRGSIALKGGAVTVVPIGQRFTGVTSRLSLEGRRIELETLRFDSGAGRASGSGELAIGDGWSLDGGLFLRLDSFPIIRPGLPEGVLTAELDAALERRGHDTKVTLSIENTDLQLLSREAGEAPEPIETSRHIVLVDGDREPIRGDGEGDVAGDDPGRLRLKVRIPDALRVHGAGVEMSWDGELAMTWEDDAFGIDGAIETDHGYFQLLGNNMWIEKGEITLPPDGTPKPIIYVLAHANTPEADVTMSLSGRMSRPHLRLSSTPPLTQYEIMTLLVTGKAHSGRGEDDNEVQAQVTSMLLAVQNPLLQSELNRRLRLDYVSASVGDSIDDPIVIAGKRVNRNIYVQTRVAPNAREKENRVTGRVEYRISPHWTVETFYGDANKGGVGFYWSKRFGSSDPQANNDPPERNGAAERNEPAKSAERAESNVAAPRP